MKLNFCGATDIGKVRKKNEDRFLILENYSFFAIADGMGGHQAGDVASQICLDSIKEYIQNIKNFKEMKNLYKKVKNYFFKMSFYEYLLYSMVKQANDRIYIASISDPQYYGMGTTLILTLFYKKSVFIAHIGDSKFFRIRRGKIKQLTEDHSLFNEYIKLGIADKKEGKNFPYKNIVLKAMGLKSTPEIDIFKRKIMSGDIYLLCTDGLTDVVDEKEILNIILKKKELKDGCENLIERANVNGGIDNITVILIEVIEA